MQNIIGVSLDGSNFTAIVPKGDDKNNEEKDYYVTFAANVRYVAAVRASSLEEAKKFAQNDFENACFGKLEFVDSDLIMIEDEDGNYLYEK